MSKRTHSDNIAEEPPFTFTNPTSKHPLGDKIDAQHPFSFTNPTSKRTFSDIVADANNKHSTGIDELLRDIKRTKPLDYDIAEAARCVVRYKPLSLFMNITQGDSFPAPKWVNMHRLYIMYVNWSAYSTSETTLEFNEFKRGLIHLNFPVKFMSSVLTYNKNNVIEQPRFILVVHITVCERVISSLKKLEYATY